MVVDRGEGKGTSTGLNLHPLPVLTIAMTTHTPTQHRGPCVDSLSYASLFLHVLRPADLPSLVRPRLTAPLSALQELTWHGRRKH